MPRHDAMPPPNPEPADRLDHFWNTLASDGEQTDLDPARAALIRRLHALANDPVPDSTRERVRRQVAALTDRTLIPEEHTVNRINLLPTVTSPLPNGRISTRPAQVPRRRLVRLRRWGSALEAVAAAVLIVALIGGYAALNGGFQGLTGSPGSLQQAATPEGGVFGVGEGFTGGGSEVMQPVADGGPAAVYLHRVSIAPATMWVLPPEAAVMVWVEFGTLVVESGDSSREVVVSDGIHFPTGAVTMRNDDSALAVALLATVADGSLDIRLPVDLPTGVTIETLGGGDVGSLPSNPVFALIGELKLGAGQETGVEDTGPNGLALVLVEAGTLQLTLLAGDVQVGGGEPATGAVTDGNVTLAAGDSALLTNGAALTMASAGDEALEARFVSLQQDSPFPEQEEVIASPPADVVVTGLFATPAAGAEIISPAECTVEPRGAEEIANLSATPPATPAVEPTPYIIQSEADLPQGEPADEETVAAVAAVERQFVACYNAGDLPRILAVMTDNIAAELLADLEGEDAGISVTTPATAVPAGERIALYPIRGVRVLPDGRVGAIVEWGRPDEPGAVSEANFHIFVNVDGTWLLDEEIGSFNPDHQQFG